MATALWKKVESEVDITNFKVNMPFLKFLGQGIPDYPVPTNNSDYKTYLIESRIHGEIGLKDAELGNGPVPSSIGTIHISLLHKTLASLIEDGHWWYLL